jgi:hypothetical protein
MLGVFGLAVLVAVLWTTLRSSRVTDPPATSAEAAPASSVAAAPELAESKLESRAEPGRREEEVPPAVEPGPKHEAVPKTASAPAARKPDLDARKWILFRVKDEQGAPVPGAEIRLDGLRRKSERGSVYAWRGAPDHGTTAVDGTLKLPCPLWITLDDETASVVVFVHHPDFTTYEDQDCLLADTVDIVLKRGSVLVIAGWFESKDRVVTDVKPHFSWEVDLKADDWLPRRDGRLTTTRMKPGKHAVYLEWKSPDHGVCYSELTAFETVAGEDQELLLELVAAKTLRGHLGPEVPRPVVDGEVSVGVQFRGPESQGAILVRRGAPVAADGTFEVDGLPAGEAQIVGICRGFAAVPSERSKEFADRMVAQELDLRKIDGDYELRMEPTATLEIEFQDPEGKPAPGILVNAWPNVCWRVQACSGYSDVRSWSAESDANGRARIEDLPAGDHWFGVASPELELPKAEATTTTMDRTRRATFAPGETVRLAFALEKKDGG